MISEFFDGKALNKSLNPDEAVVYGATIQAGILSGNNTYAISDILLMDVTGPSFGVSAYRNGSDEPYMKKIVEKNSVIPIEKIVSFRAKYDNFRKARLIVL